MTEVVRAQGLIDVVHPFTLDVVEIPTNRPMIRVDTPDVIYRTEREKNNAIVQEITDLWKEGRPVLVGTRSIEKSEKLSTMLRQKGVPHQVLNAKFHEMEAQIISQAVAKATVTIATNMAGRGTDIVLGGNPADAEQAQTIKQVGDCTFWAPNATSPGASTTSGAAAPAARAIPARPVSTWPWMTS